MFDFSASKKIPAQENVKKALPCGADVMTSIPRGKSVSGREWKDPKSKYFLIHLISKLLSYYLYYLIIIQYYYKLSSYYKLFVDQLTENVIIKTLKNIIWRFFTLKTEKFDLKNQKNKNFDIFFYL